MHCIVKYTEYHTHAHTHACTHTHTGMHTHMHTHAHTHTRMHTHTCTHMHTHTCTRTCMLTYMHTHTNTHCDTHMHIHIYLQFKFKKCHLGIKYSVYDGIVDFLGNCLDPQRNPDPGEKLGQYKYNWVNVKGWLWGCRRGRLFGKPDFLIGISYLHSNSLELTQEC